MVLGINPREGQAVAGQFADEFGIEFPVLVDSKSVVYSNYLQDGQTPFPLDYIIDQNGIVRYFNTEYRPQEMIKMIDRLLGISDVREPEKRQESPEYFLLNQNYPNPIASEQLKDSGTRINIRLKRDDKIRLEIFNLIGQRIETLHAGFLAAGEHSFTWFGRNHYRPGTASGIYFITLTGTNVKTSKKIIILP